MNQDIDNKKRLMFVKGEDFYFLTYNTILILELLGCHCGVRRFADYRRLAFLVDFVADYNLVSIIRNNTNHVHLNAIDRDLLMRTYSNGMLRINQIIRLLFTLEKKGLIILERNQSNNVVDVCLSSNEITKGLIDEDLFNIEIQNVHHLKNHIRRLNNLTLETTLKRLFDNYGILRWDVY